MAEKKDRIRTRTEKPGIVLIKGKITRKVLENQKNGVADFRMQEDREGGATRTNRKGRS